MSRMLRTTVPAATPPARGGSIAVTLVSVLALGACADAWVAPYNDSFSEPAIRADMLALSDDSTRGRLVGTPELEKAGDWIRNRFDSLGLAPAGDESTYDQRFDMMWFSLGEGNELTVGGSGGARRPGQGWYPLNFSASTRAAGEVVFAGYGIVEPRLGWDDYQGANVSGKVVLVLEGEPGANDPDSPFDGLVTAHQAREWNKALAAQKRGAVALLMVRDVRRRPDVEDWAAAAAENWPEQPRRIERFLLRPWVEGITIPGAMISAELAEALVSRSGRTLRELADASEAASNGLGAVELPGTRVTLRTTVERHVTPGRNIVAMIEGTDLKDQAVILMGHYDHNGAAGDTVYNGADDNNSGVVGLLAVAGAYAHAAADGHRPRRSVVFAITDAEERGPSLGAWHLTLDPPFPLANTAAVFNVDMIGRNEEIPADGGARFNGLGPQTAGSNANAVNIIGYSRAPTLAAAVDSANRETKLTVRMRYDNNASTMLRRSDQWPYLQNDVPAVWFHTGLHPEYHTPFDDEDRINYEKMIRIVRLIHQVSWNVANSDQRFAVEPMGSRPAS